MDDDRAGDDRDDVNRWLTTRQAAHRLGVKPATLYAYASRGVVRSHRTPDGRESRFAADEIEVLARRGRPRQASRSPSLDIDIRTSITRIDDHRIHYRGHDAFALAREAAFEQVAELLWTGTLPRRPTVWIGERFDTSAERLGDRLRLVAAHAAARPGAGHRLDPERSVVDGQQLIASLVDSIPARGRDRCPSLILPSGQHRRTIAGRLWPRLTVRAPRPALVAAVNAALVLMADHEMAASTLAARVAASTRAGVHGVVAAGMGALSGPLHGGESWRARGVLAAAAERPVDDVISDALDRYGRLPGHGQVLYPDGDPRATVLFEMLRDAGDHPALDAVEQVRAGARRRALPPPNVDLALAALGMAIDAPADAGEALFTVARVAGWIAHAMEEHDERPLRFRPRATYVGVEPS